MKNKQLMSTKERAYAGCIVTLANQESSETKVVHLGGYTWEERPLGHRKMLAHTMTDALREMCDRVDTWEGDWKVRTISTPQSILADIQGRRENAHGGPPTHPESIILAQIDRLDLWEKGYTAEKTERRARVRRSA